MKKSRWISSLCAAVILAGVIAGCQSAPAPQASEAPPTGTNGASDPKAATLPSGPVTLRMSWWGGESRHKATLAVFDEYKKKFPNVTIEAEYSGSTGPYLTKLLTQLAGSTAPDIIQLDYKWLKDMVEQKGNFINYKDYLDRFDTSNIDMKLAEQYTTYNDFMLGLPVGLNAYAMVYNPAVFEQHNLTPIEQPTWDDLLELGAKLHSADSSKYLIIPMINHNYLMFKMMMMQKTGKNIINDQDYSIQITREDALEFFNWMDKAFETGTLPPVQETSVYGSSYIDQIPGWHDGRYAMATAGASNTGTTVKSTKFPIAVNRFPVMKDPVNPGIFTPVSMMFGINAKSKNIDQAIDFVNWYLNDENAIMIMKDERGVPVNKKARQMLQDVKAVLPEVTKIIETASTSAGNPESAMDTNPELQAIFDNYWQMMGFKKITPEQAVDGYLTELKKALDAMKAKKG